MSSKQYWTNYPEPYDEKTFARIEDDCRRDATMQDGTSRIIDPSTNYYDNSDLPSNLPAKQIITSPRLHVDAQLFAACMRAHGFRQVSEEEARRIHQLRQQEQPSR